MTLPGGPQMAAGSNGDVAWGFTNSVGDWWDLVIVDPVPGDPTRYQTPDGARAFDLHQESIAVKGAAPVPVEARWTIWGPVVGDDHRRRPVALKWVAHDPRVLATDAARIAEARDVDEAMRLSVGAALAAENLVVGDTRWPDRLDDLRRHPEARRLPRRRADLRGGRLAAVGTAT